MGILVLLSNMYVHSQNSLMLNATALEKVMHCSGIVLRNLTVFKIEQKRESDFLVLSKHGSITSITDWGFFGESQKQILTFKLLTYLFQSAHKIYLFLLNHSINSICIFKNQIYQLSQKRYINSESFKIL